jgi:methyl-galactoside transport system substrate-binding protein
MKILKKISLCLLTVTIGTSLSACNYNNNGTNKDSIKNIKIGVTLYRQDDAFISAITKELEDVAKEEEGDSNYKITINVVDAKGSLTNQNNQVERFVSQNYDVICVNIVDRTAASMMIDKAKSANIPMIFFNREPVEEDMERWDKLYYVGAKAEQSGEIQGKIILDAYKSNRSLVDKNGDGKIQYVVLEGEPGHQDTLIRTEHCIKPLIENGVELEKLSDEIGNWQYAQATTKMNQWIKEFGDKIEVVFSNNDEMALGALEALNNNNTIKRHPLVVGIDGIPESLTQVKNGAMIGTAINDYKYQAKVIFNMAYILSTNGDINSVEGLEKGKYVMADYSEVTKDNVDIYMKSK